MKSTLCFVCRRSVGYWTSAHYPNESLFKVDKSWKKYYRDHKRRARIVNAADLEGKYFEPKGHAHWSYLYRLIFYDSERKQLVISGIGQYNSTATTNAAAKHPNKALIGGGKANNNAEITEHYTRHQLGWWHESPLDSHKNIEFQRMPLAIHMGCWKLVQWQLGPSVKNYLELFVASMLKISTNYLLEEWEELEGWEELANFEEWEGAGPLSGTYDAYRIAQAQELIEASRASKKRRKKRPYARFSGFLLLPAELLDMVLDHLTVKQIQKLEAATGILVADRYWRRRAAGFLVEMDEIAGEDLDWRYLCRKWELISENKEFEEYHRIVGILRDQVNPLFLKKDVYCSSNE